MESMSILVVVQRNTEESFARSNQWYLDNKCIRRHLHASIMIANMEFASHHQELMATYANVHLDIQVGSSFDWEFRNRLSSKWLRYKDDSIETNLFYFRKKMWILDKSQFSAQYILRWTGTIEPTTSSKRDANFCNRTAKWCFTLYWRQTTFGGRAVQRTYSCFVWRWKLSCKKSRKR